MSAHILLNLYRGSYMSAYVLLKIYIEDHT